MVVINLSGTNMLAEVHAVAHQCEGAYRLGTVFKQNLDLDSKVKLEAVFHVRP